MVNGAKIKEWVKEQALSPEEAAVKFKCSLATVINLCNGESARLETIRNVAREMGCQIEDLLNPNFKKQKAASQRKPAA